MADTNGTNRCGGVTGGMKKGRGILSNVDGFPSKFQILSKFHMSLALKM
jgi:chorismate synthase